MQDDHNKESEIVVDVPSVVDKILLTNQNLGRVFNSRSGCKHAMQLCVHEIKLPSLQLIRTYYTTDIVLKQFGMEQPFHWI